MTLADYLAVRSAEKPSGCLEWTGSVTRGGYGTVNFGGLKTTAHRAAWIAAHGAIGHGLEIDHLCKNTRCIRVAHLEAVTHAENVRRSELSGKTHCKNGHAFDEANTFIKANGTKSCRVCNAERQRALRAKHPGRYRAYDNKRRSKT